MRIWALAFVCVLTLFARGGWAEPHVRVQLLESSGVVVVEGRDLRVAGRSLEAGRVELRAAADRVVWEGGSASGSTQVHARALRVGGRPVEGSLLLVPRGSRLDVVNELPLEPYVERVMDAEIYSSWPIEVLKAQAVIARSYALYERDRNAGQVYHLRSSVISQRYEPGLASAPAQRATRETRGEHLVFKGRPILAAFHASAGGQTAASDEVWPEELPYLRSVPSPDDDGPDFFWSFELPRKELVRTLREAGYQPVGEARLEVMNRSQSGRVQKLHVDGAELSGRELRQLLGGSALRSTLFEVRAEDVLVRFLGSGSGHGVGLSQWGARALAEQGQTYREILNHYYPGTRMAQTDDASASR